MRRQVVIVLLAISLDISPVQGQRGLPPPPSVPEVVIDTPIAIEDGGYLPEHARRRFELQAMAGDPEAAMRIVAHYRTGIAKDNAMREMWTTIAAENGSSIAMYNLWIEEQEAESVQKHLRACFWLAKSAKSGNSAAAAEPSLTECLAHSRGD